MRSALRPRGAAGDVELLAAGPNAAAVGDLPTFGLSVVGADDAAQLRRVAPQARRRWLRTHGSRRSEDR